MKLFLVTGGAGFIGSNIVRKLLSDGYAVRVIDNLSTGNTANLEDVNGDIDFISGDICDFSTVQASVKDVDYIIHQAALPSVPRSIQDPISSNLVNVNGTLNLLVAAKDAKVQKFVMASSSSVYGNTPELPKHEDMAPQPLSPYATSKIAGERYAMNFASLYGLPTVALRYFNVFGPYQDPKSFYSAVIPKFIRAILKGEPVIVHGDGEQSRDFTFVENVIDANIRACLSEACGEFMNVACGGRYTLNQLVQLLQDIIGTKAQVQYQESRNGDVKHSHAAIDKAKIKIGYSPEVSFEDGLKKTVEWYKFKINETAKSSNR